MLVERGLFESRAKAQAAIEAGLVRADGAAVRKASDEIAFDAELHRDAGASLCFARRRSSSQARSIISVSIRMDAFVSMSAPRPAASRKCCWSAAPRKVYAVDVGSGQLHAKLRGDSRVVSLEQTDIRKVTAAQLDAPPDFVCIDVSFIPLKLVLPPALALAAPAAQLVALIKPQFEAGPEHNKKGIVRDAAVQQAVCADIDAFVASLGWQSRSASSPRRSKAAMAIANSCSGAARD